MQRVSLSARVVYRSLISALLRSSPFCPLKNGNVDSKKFTLFDYAITKAIKDSKSHVHFTKFSKYEIVGALRDSSHDSTG